MKLRLLTVCLAVTVGSAAAIAVADEGVVPSGASPLPVSLAATPTPRFDWSAWWAKPGYWKRRVEGARRVIDENKSKKFDIVFCGDSNTQNWEGWTDPEDIANLQCGIAAGKITEEAAFISPKSAWLDLQKRYKVLNLGISGDSTQHLLWRLTEGGLLDGYEARYFCVLIGSNNCYQKDESGEPENILAGIRAIITAIRAKHPEAKILLHKCTPTYRKIDDPVEIRHERLNELIPSLANGKDVILCDFTAPLKNADGSQNKRYFADGLHLNNAGFQVWSRYVLAAMGDEIRVGAIDWDCSVPRGTYFGNAVAKSLGPEHWRDRTPFFAKDIGKDRIEIEYRTLAEYERELQYAIDAGLDYLAYCWYDCNPNLAPSPDHACAACGHLQEITLAHKLHAKSALRDRLHLCAILVACHPYSDDELTALALEMREPWYEKVGGRPLVYYGFTTKGEVAMRLRAICRRLGAVEPYVVLMNDEPKAIARLGAEKTIDAACVYAHVAYGSYPEIVEQMITNNAKRASAGLPVVPHLSLGWDGRPRVENPVPWTKYKADGVYATAKSEADFKFAATKLKEWMRDNAKSCTTGHVLTFAWNEFEEGGWICPNLGADGNPDVSRVKWFKAASDILKH